MCMILTQCIDFVNFCQRRAAQFCQIIVPLDAPLALVVEYVATALRLTTHPKLHKNNQNWGVGSSCGTNKPPLALLCRSVAFLAHVQFQPLLLSRLLSCQS